MIGRRNLMTHIDMLCAFITLGVSGVSVSSVWQNLCIPLGLLTKLAALSLALKIDLTFYSYNISLGRCTPN